MRRLTLVHRGRHGLEELSIELAGDVCVLVRGGSTESAAATWLPDGRLALRLEGGRQICGRVLPSNAGRVEISTRRGIRRVSLADPLQDRLAHAADDAAGEGTEDEVRTLMPGRVVEISVHAGDRVAAGGLLLVLEAMKMQNEIRAERGGTVSKIDAEPGQTVEAGALLAVIQTDAGES